MDILRVEGIRKSFSGVNVLKDINLSIKYGELHAIVGENGAGKSTLMKIIAGELEPDSGKIYLNEKEVQFHSPLDAINYGIALIHQEFSLVPQLTVYENIFLGREMPKSFLGINCFVDKKKMKKEAQNVLKTFEIENINVNSRVKDLSIANKQLTEIAKALSTNSKILIMDEPTAALTLKETEKLFSILENLKSNGVTIIFISHRLEEIFQIADSVTILRNGELIATKDINKVSMEEIVSMMIGKSMTNRFPPKPDKRVGDAFFEVKHLSSDAFKDVNFSLRKGEILGIAGLVGCGNTQVGESIYGLRKFEGEIYLEGKKVNISKPTDAIQNGIFLVPEDRHDIGLVLQLSVRENHSLPNLDLFSKVGFVSTSIEKKSVKDTIAYLNTKVSSINQRVDNLSGGNQQKVVLGKWLVRSPKILILDEPTRGIDVGAKFEIYKFIYEQSSKGVSIILISSELAEVLNLSDRILVMSEGRITKELNPKNATQEDILKFAVKGKES